MRVLVTGSRDWTSHGLIMSNLDILRVFVPDTKGITVVHGGCPTGADAIADHFARAAGYTVEVHPAAWQTYGKAAGFRRNAEMVRAGADLCLAFLRPCVKVACRETERHFSHGASHCMAAAQRAGIETRRWFEE